MILSARTFIRYIARNSLFYISEISVFLLFFEQNIFDYLQEQRSIFVANKDITPYLFLAYCYNLLKQSQWATISAGTARKIEFEFKLDTNASDFNFTSLKGAQL